MAITTYYIDGNSLATATAIYTDATLTTCAPDGYYSDGLNVRQQISCVLQPAEVCPSCATGCGSSISGTGGQGFRIVNLDTGTDTGAIIVAFDPQSIPDGIRAIYDGVIYNELSSVNDGYRASSTPGNFTFIGRTSSDCGISGTTYPSLIEYEYGSTTWIATGNTVGVTVDAGDVSLGTSVPGWSYIVIPKPTASPSTVTIQIVGPCSNTAFQVNALCPALLTGFQSSSVEPDKETVCSATTFETYYNAPVNGTAGVPGLYDWVFTDAYGQTALDAGWYRLYSHPTADAMRVDSNGVIDLLNNCATIFISTFRPTCSDFCDTNYIISLARDTYPRRTTLASVAIGDLIGGNNTNGFYAYSDVFTDTDTGPFRIMELVNNYVTGIYQCDGTLCQGL